jgi:tryptophan halogenase
MKQYKIVIVGGGTAGWFAAAWLSKFRKGTITLIENPDIPKIGVGESITPHVQRFFDLLELDTKDWMESTSAIYKYANKFVNWVDRDTEYFGFSYTSNTKEFTDPKFDLMRMLEKETTRTTDVFLELYRQQHLNKFDKYFNDTYSYMENNTMPFINGEYQCNPFYSWSQHINADLASEYVKERIAIPNGVTHIQSNVKDIITTGDTVNSLILDDGTQIDADIVIDCTGFKGAIVNKLNFEKIQYTDNFVDSAWVCQLDYTDPESEMVNYTQSIAQDYGWLFKIGLYHRMGSGYCFSSKHISKEDALKAYQGMVSNLKGTPRLLTWTPGRLKEAARGNVVSVGLSSGFVEPLEANALFIITSSIVHLDKVLEQYEQTSKLDFVDFNKDIAYLIDDIADFIRVHYSLSNRQDTQFWRDCANNRPAEQEQELVRDKYYNEKGSIVNSAQYKTMFPNYMWLQLALAWNLDVSEWPVILDKNLFSNGLTFFRQKYYNNNVKAASCLNTYKWLKENIYGVESADWKPNVVKTPHFNTGLDTKTK